MEGLGGKLYAYGELHVSRRLHTKTWQFNAGKLRHSYLAEPDSAVMSRKHDLQAPMARHGLGGRIGCGWGSRTNVGFSSYKFMYGPCAGAWERLSGVLAA